jgi:hypothetical protein
VTIYVPGAVYVCTGFCSVDDVPSPNVQLYVYGRYPPVYAVENVSAVSTVGGNGDTYIPPVPYPVPTAVVGDTVDAIYAVAVPESPVDISVDTSTTLYAEDPNVISSRYIPVYVRTDLSSRDVMVHTYRSVDTDGSAARSSVRTAPLDAVGIVYTGVVPTPPCPYIRICIY